MHVVSVVTLHQKNIDELIPCNVTLGVTNLLNVLSTNTYYKINVTLVCV